MPHLPRLTFALVLFSLVARVASAQVSLDLPVVVLVPASARAAGTGDAYPLATPDADAIFYNPALLDAARGISVSLSRFGSGSQSINAAGSVAWLGGGLSFGATSLSYGAASISDGAFARGEAGLFEQGGATASEQVALVSYARTKLGFRIGAAAKVIDLRVADEHHVSAAADVGAVRSLGPVTLGFSARNLGGSPDFTVVDARLPKTMTAAAATRTKAIGPLDVSLAGASSWRGRDLYTAGGGVEVAYWPISGRTFTARVGYRWIEASEVRPLTVGGGFMGDRFGVDYAFEDVRHGRPTHRVTLRVR